MAPKTIRAWLLGLVAACIDGAATLGVGLTSGGIAAFLTASDFSRDQIKTLAATIGGAVVTSALTSARRYFQANPLEEVLGVEASTTTGDINVTVAPPEEKP